MGEEVEYEIRVSAFGLAEDALEALFDRVAEAAHALDEAVMCLGWLVPSACERTFMPAELRAHDDRTRAEALAPVLALADEDPVFGDLSGRISEAIRGKAAAWIDGKVVRVERCYATGIAHEAALVVRSSLAAAFRAAAGTPTHHTTEEDADE